MLDLLKISGQLLLATLLMWLSSLISINFSGIVLPISLQSMMAILIPLIFRSKVGIAAIGLYLVIGALGVPVFAGGLGGWNYFYSTSGGYLVGFLVIAFLTSLSKNYIKGQSGFVITFLIFIFMHAILTVLGIGWLVINSMDVSFNVNVSPFLPGAVIKSIIGAAIAESWRFFKKRKTRRL